MFSGKPRMLGGGALAQVSEVHALQPKSMEIGSVGKNGATESSLRVSSVEKPPSPKPPSPKPPSPKPSDKALERREVLQPVPVQVLYAEKINEFLDAHNRKLQSTSGDRNLCFFYSMAPQLGIESKPEQVGNFAKRCGHKNVGTEFDLNPNSTKGVVDALKGRPLCVVTHNDQGVVSVEVFIGFLVSRQNKEGIVENQKEYHTLSLMVNDRRSLEDSMTSLGSDDVSNPERHVSGIDVDHTQACLRTIYSVISDKEDKEAPTDFTGQNFEDVVLEIVGHKDTVVVTEKIPDIGKDGKARPRVSGQSGGRHFEAAVVKVS